MNRTWLFWALLALGILLLVTPLFGVLRVAVAMTIWLIGGLLLIIAAIWAITLLGRGKLGATPPAV